MDQSESHYESSPEAEASDDLYSDPLINSVTVPETVKRRIPSKHYVRQGTS